MISNEATSDLPRPGAESEDKMCGACERSHVLTFPIRMPFMVYGPFHSHAEYGDKFIANPRADQLYDIMKLGMIYYDPEAQRGGPAYCLSDDPPSSKFPFDPKKVEAMAEKLERGSLFGDHLTWNLRPGDAHWSYDVREHRLWLDRSTKIFLPDSHHRHRADYLACERAREGGSLFRPDQKIFTLDIFKMPLEGEQALFYEFNVEGKKADKTRAHYVAPFTEDEAKGVAKALLNFPPFRSNVETIRNRLSKNSAAVITFGTLRDGVAENAAIISPVKVDPVSGKKEPSTDASEFYQTWFDRLSTIRPQLRPTNLAQRQQTRAASLVDQSIMWRAYFRLAADYHGESQRATESGPDEKSTVDAKWEAALGRLAEDYVYEKDDHRWTGDLFSRDNPVWRDRTVLTMTKSGKWQVNNTRDAREHVYEVLKQHLGV